MIVSSKELRKDILLISFEVENVDLNLGRELKIEFMVEIEKKYPVTIVNMEKVQFMDSSGLGILVMAWQDVSKFHGKIIFTSLSSTIKRLFSIAKIDQFVEVFDNLDQVLEQYES